MSDIALEQAESEANNHRESMEEYYQMLIYMEDL